MGSFSFLVTCLLAASTVPVMGEPAASSKPKTYDELVVLGSSLVGQKTGKKPTSYLAADTLDLCEKAHNCEIYDDPQLGKSIRFVKGKEPGSEDYNVTVVAEDTKRTKDNNSTSLLKRAPGDYARFGGGTKILNWGNVQPQVVMNKLYNPCQESSCNPSAEWTGTQAVRNLGWGSASSASAPAAYSVVFTAYGHYNGWDMRNNFVEAIKAMSEKGQQWTNVYWSWGIWTGRAWASDSGSLWEIRQSDYFSISAWSANGAMKGYMQVSITPDWGDKADWGCDRARDLVKDAISAINGWAGAFFGFITPACG